jgi:hypothetical protein
MVSDFFWTLLAGVIIGAFGSLMIWFKDQPKRTVGTPHVYLSGAISGHEGEAQVYFAEAEKLVREVFPGCQVFNPTNLPELDGWESYMEICRAVLEGWATHVVVIVNPYTHRSRGVSEEIGIAYENKIPIYRIEGGVITRTDKYTEPLNAAIVC